METYTCDISDRERNMPAADIRNLSADQWIAEHASGSLQKAKLLNASWRQLYIEERTAHEWGWGFVCLPRSRCTFGDAIMEGDCPAMTEAVWHACRAKALNRFPDSDEYEFKYLQVDSDDVRSEGAGLVLRKTSASWIPGGHMVIAIIAEFDPREGEWKEARNPL